MTWEGEAPAEPWRRQLGRSLALPLFVKRLGIAKRHGVTFYTGAPNPLEWAKRMKINGRARLLPSWRRDGSAGASPSRVMNWLVEVDVNMFTGVEKSSRSTLSHDVWTATHLTELLNEMLADGTHVDAPRAYNSNGPAV